MSYRASYKTESLLCYITEPLLCYINSECVLESRDPPTSGNNLSPFASSCAGNVSNIIVILLALNSPSLADC